MHLRTTFNYKLHTTQDYQQILFALKGRNNSSLATNNTLNEEFIMTYKPAQFSDTMHQNLGNNNETKHSDAGNGYKNSSLQLTDNIIFENISNSDSTLPIEKNMIIDRYYAETSTNKQNFT